VRFTKPLDSYPEELAKQVARHQNVDKIVELTYRSRLQRIELEKIETELSRKFGIAELEPYLTQIIERFAEPDRRGIRRLEGNFSRMRIRKNPDSVLIADDRALPVAWKDIVVAMPAYSWEALFQRFDLEDRAYLSKR
jgi:hypothetical protein